MRAGAFLLYADSSVGGVSRAEGAIANLKGIGRILIEYYLVIAVSVSQTGGGAPVVACSPFNVEYAVGSYSGGRGKDTVATRRCDLVGCEWENSAGKAGVRQAAGQEVIDKCAERKVAVRTGGNRGEGTLIQIHRERQVDQGAAVVGVVADIICRRNYCGCAGDDSIVAVPARCAGRCNCGGVGVCVGRRGSSSDGGSRGGSGGSGEGRGNCWRRGSSESGSGRRHGPYPKVCRGFAPCGAKETPGVERRSSPVHRQRVHGIVSAAP